MFKRLATVLFKKKILFWQVKVDSHVLCLTQKCYLHGHFFLINMFQMKMVDIGIFRT